METWGCQPPSEKKLNGAVMHFRKNSSTIGLFIATLRKHLKTVFLMTEFGTDLYAEALENKQPEFFIFPCFAFDPDWYENNFEFFAKNHHSASYNSSEKYDGPFGVHWHGNRRWGITPEIGSRWDLYETLYQELWEKNRQTIQAIKRNVPKFQK
jgi:hypothetical protein